MEARATGVAASLDALEQWLHHGPPGARVTQVESDIVDVNDALAAESQALDFDIVR